MNFVYFIDYIYIVFDFWKIGQKIYKNYSANYLVSNVKIFKQLGNINLQTNVLKFSQ